MTLYEEHKPSIKLAVFTLMLIFTNVSFFYNHDVLSYALALLEIFLIIVYTNITIDEEVTFNNFIIDILFYGNICVYLSCEALNVYI